MTKITDTSDILVLIPHPHGDIEITLQEWMKKGPGKRNMIQPVSVRHRITGEHMTLKTIPLAYRNNFLSRTLIRLGFLADPWNNP